MTLMTWYAGTARDACIGCGRCTYTCVAAQRYEGFSPRRVVEDTLNGKPVQETRGPVGLHLLRGVLPALQRRGGLPQLVRELRAVRRKDELSPAGPPWRPGPGRQAQLVERPRPRTAGWVTPDLELDEGSDTLLFVGCTPYFDVVFNYFRA